MCTGAYITARVRVCVGVITMCVKVCRGVCVCVCTGGAYVAAEGCMCACMGVHLSVS